jgi:gliding motility-associated-like protein
MKLILARLSLVFISFFLSAINAFAQPSAGFTAVDPDGCAPHTAVFTNSSTGTGTLTYTWDFGDPNSPGTSNQQNPSHIYALPGQYTVTLTVTDANGTDVETKTNFITVFRNPTAHYTISDDTICSGQSITFTDSSVLGDGPITQWEWTFNDGSPTVTGVSSVVHTYTNLSSQIAVYVTVLTVTDVNGCNSIVSSDSVFILPSPTASYAFSFNSCTFPITVNFTNTSSGPSLYNWDFGDPSSGSNNFSTLTSPTHTYANPGNYLVTLSNGVPGCLAVDTTTIELTQVTSSFTISDTVACRNDSVLFTSTSTPSSASTQWFFGDGSPSSFLPNPSHAYINTGTYTVTLTVTQGGCSSSSSRTVRVPSPPSLIFTSADRTSCVVPFIASFAADTTSQNVAWAWSFGDPGSGALNFSTLQNPTHTYTGFGSYDITLVVTDVNGCSDSIVQTSYIDVLEPTVDFTIQDSGCVGDIFTYNSIVSSPADPVITNYVWDFGDGTPPVSGAIPGTTHQFNAVGIYDVTLTITTQSGCTATLTKTGFARVGTKPDAQIDSVQHIICFKGNVQFNDASPPPITGWLWYFGDGGSSTEQNPGWQYNLDTSGTVDPFDVILFTYYNGCADTDTVANMVTVQSPIPFFEPVYNCNNPNSVSFTNLSGGATGYSWDFGDSSPLSTDTNPTHIYTGPGTYSVTLTANNSANGCTVDTVIEVQITNLTAIASSNTIIACHPGLINFTGSTSQDASAYLWNFDDPSSGVFNISREADTLHIFNAPGFYTVQLTTIDINMCSKTDTIQVHIIGPTAGFSADAIGSCSQIFITFTDTSLTEGGAITQWIWNYGTGAPNDTTFSGQGTHTYASTGSFSVTLTTIDVNGCRDVHTSLNYINITVPTAGILIPDTNACRNTPEIFIGSAGAPGTFVTPVTYEWNFGDGQTYTDTSNIASHTYASNGNYTVSLKVTDANGCSDSTSREIFVFTTSADFSVTTTSECVVDALGIKRANVKAVFNSDSTAYTSQAIYDWDMTVFRDSNSTFGNYTYNFNVPPGSYDVTLILTNDLGCKDTVVQPGAVVVPGPTGNFSFVPDSGCTPLTVTFTGTSANSSIFAWDFGDGSVATGTSSSTVTHTYTQPGNYTPQFLLGFQLTNDFCYIPVDTIGDVVVTSLLLVDILEDTLFINEGQKDTLNVIVTNGTPPYTYTWSPPGRVESGPTSSSFLATIPSGAEYYTVEVPYGTLGCSGTDKVFVVLILEECELSWDSIPNVFTPNGDFLNDNFYIKDLCHFDGFFIKIFNRWGKIIYESTNPEFKWDGVATDGSKAAEGTYYYVLKAKTREWHGYINLIRDEQ